MNKTILGKFYTLGRNIIWNPFTKFLILKRLWHYKDGLGGLRREKKQSFVYIFFFHPFWMATEYFEIDSVFTAICIEWQQIYLF